MGRPKINPSSAMALAARTSGQLGAAALAGDRPCIAAEAARAAPPSSWRLVIIRRTPLRIVKQKRLGARRRVPLAGERVRRRTIEAHGQIERSLRRGEPVDLFARPRALVLEIEIKRAVQVIFERHPTAHREAVEAVCHLKAVT